MAEYYTAVKMDGLQPHVEIYTILVDIGLSHKASPRTYSRVGVRTHEGEGMASTKSRRVTAFGGNQENDAYIGGYVLVLGAGGGFGEVTVHEWSLNEWMNEETARGRKCKGERGRGGGVNLSGRRGRGERRNWGKFGPALELDTSHSAPCWLCDLRKVT